jgi:hypothetical protein
MVHNIEEAVSKNEVTASSPDKNPIFVILAGINTDKL